MSLALLFPGQASQHPQMLQWVDSMPEAAPVLAQLAKRISPDWRNRLGQPQWAHDNRVAQCLITGLGLAAWQCLSQRLPKPCAVAGYSVGELAAFSAAGVFDAATALALADLRAESMDRCVVGIETGLLAVTGLTRHPVDALCARLGLAVAIDIGPDRFVIGGTDAALVTAADSLACHGVRHQRLPIGLASHTACLLPAVDAFGQALQNFVCREPGTVLVSNRSGARVRTEAQLRSVLAEQIAHPVRWSEVLESIAQQRPGCVLEVGAGTGLADLWRARFPDIPARSIDEFRSAEGVVSWVERVLQNR